MTDMTHCSIADLAAEFRKTADKASKEKDFLRCLVFNIVAQRFERCEALLEDWLKNNGASNQELVDRTKKELGK
jgi:hypothetical protein